jgi:osmotically inducible lipoprotein OsmB
MRRAIIASVLIAALGLSACGTSPGERALSGAGIGAGAGALGGALLGANPLAGALLGGAAGAAVGGLSSKDDINLGKPAWK